MTWPLAVVFSDHEAGKLIHRSCGGHVRSPWLAGFRAQLHAASAGSRRETMTMSKLIASLLVVFALAIGGVLAAGCGGGPLDVPGDAPGDVPDADVTTVTVDGGTAAEVEQPSGGAEVACVSDGTPFDPCAPGYERRIKTPRDAVYCYPIDGAEIPNPCVESHVITWLGGGAVRCARIDCKAYREQ